jgi:hypothetical protein
MKKTSIAMFLCLMASFILPSCEKAVIDEYPQMESFYVESKGLNFVTIDSVRTFSSKVDGFVAVNPLAKEHEKYPLIQANIKSASLRLTITVDTTWAGEKAINF